MRFVNYTLISNHTRTFIFVWENVRELNFWTLTLKVHKKTNEIVTKTRKRQNKPPTHSLLLKSRRDYFTILSSFSILKNSLNVYDHMPLKITIIIIIMCTILLTSSRSYTFKTFSLAASYCFFLHRRPRIVSVEEFISSTSVEVRFNDEKQQ